MTLQTSAKNKRQREALHKSQFGLCHYCRDPIGTYVGDKGDPVLEHHTPRSKGGRRAHIVLACGSCDKQKGMMNGREFSDLIAMYCTAWPISMGARMEVAAAAKARNAELQAEHRVRNKQPSIPRVRLHSKIVLISAVFQEDAAHCGNSGRDEFIRQWEENRPGTK